MKRFVLSLSASLALLVSAQGAGFAAWGKSMEIQFSGYPGAADPLTNFPVLVILEDGNNGVDFADFETEGADLRFTDGDVSTDLNFEIEAWADAQNRSTVWVQVPVLTNNAKIVAYWKMTGETAPPCTTNGSVWSNGYAGVWHLSETSGTHADSSTNNNVGTAQDDTIQGTSAMIAGGIQLDGTGDYVVIPDHVSLRAADNFTASAWVRRTADGLYDGVISKVRRTPDIQGWNINFHDSENKYASFLGSSHVYEYIYYDSGSATDYAWHHLALRREGGTASLFLDGQLQSASSTIAVSDSEDSLVLGRFYSNLDGHCLEGFIDEARVSSTSRSDNWLWACWSNQVADSAFCTYGAAETRSAYAAADTLAPTNVSSTGASFNGGLSSTGLTATAVFVFWGEADGVTNSTWANTNAFGFVDALGPLTTNITLSAGKEYFYRYAASNAPGLRWATSSAYLLTTNVTVDVTPETVGENGETATFSIARPASLTNGSLTVSFGIGGTADDPDDYTGQGIASVTLDPGDTNDTFDVTTVLDARLDGPETVVVTLDTGTYTLGASASATLTITNIAKATVNQTVATGSWHSPSVWSEVYVPLPGQNALVEHDLLLTNSTAALASLTVSEVLTATNWTTVISADDVTIESGGNITTPVVPYLNARSNRVHIVCRDFTIEANGQINVDAKGYGGGWAADGSSSSRSVGIGPGASAYGAAGHGGWGGDQGTYSSAQYYGGPTYSDPAAPIGPGSGGTSLDGRTGRIAGNGGGSVRIEASGHVLVNGTITANGVAGSGGARSSPGSAGAIWISCRTLAGTNGLVRADGATQTDSRGSGAGRIAVVYDTAAQANLVRPSVVFSARGGLTLGTGGACDADIGTLYFSDTRFADGPVIPHTGQLLFSNAPPAIAYDNLTVSNGWVRFPDGLESLTITNHLVVQGSSGRLDIGGNTYYTARRYWRVNNTSTQVTTLAVGGDLVLTNGGAMKLVAAATNATTILDGVVVNVAGDILIESGSWLQPQSSPANGGSPRITCHNLAVRDGGEIDGFESGFAGGLKSAGMGPGGASRGGGGYGGRGGYYDSTASYPGGQTYASSNAPVYAGSGGGSSDARAQMAGGYGGGRVRIVASGRIDVDGTVDVSGGRRGNNYSSGGSGGGIYLDCRHFNGAASGMMISKGGYGANFGGGGGGRIAVWYGDVPAYAGGFNVDGGAGGSGSFEQDGGTGTVVLVDVGPVITNTGTGVTTADKAWLTAELTSSGGAPTTVTVFWGESNEDTDKDAWDTNETYVVAELGSVSNLVTALSPQTQYYFRYYATNAYGSKWAPDTHSFSTVGGPVVTTGVGPTDKGRSSVTFNGDVISGNPTPLAYFCWGESDVGITSTGAWDHVIDKDEQLGPFSASVSNLLANKTYVYRCYVTNSHGPAWSSVTNFTTLPPALDVSDAAVVEGALATDTGAVFVLVLSDASAVDVLTDYSTSDGTAVAGSDYTAKSGTLTIPAGTLTGTVTVVVTGDGTDEYPSEAFTLNFSNVVDAVQSDVQAVGTIWDDDDTAQTKRWTGTGFWADAARWTPTGLPSPSDDVVIESGTATLSANAMIDSPFFGGGTNVMVNSLVVSNAATLVFTNWTALLNVAGDVLVKDTATITTPTVPTGSTQSNRVNLVCNNMTIETGGRIDVDNKGYGGGWAGDEISTSPSTGGGPGGGTLGPGSYGGRGGSSGNTVTYMFAGNTYGVSDAPTIPGSGGGSIDGRAGRQGGNGGGAVRVVAAAHVLVNGAITANGGPQGPSGNSSPGSGGAIWITCRTFGGTNGLVSADARDGGRGGVAGA